MAKKQTRRSISVSRTTYERLKAFCETNSISMSQLVETRVNDFLGESSEGSEGRLPASMPAPRPAPAAPRPVPPVREATAMPVHSMHSLANAPASPAPYGLQPVARPAPLERPAPQPVPMTSAAARSAVEPPPPIIKQKQDTAAPKPAEKRPDQIFTF